MKHVTNHFSNTSGLCFVYSLIRKNSKWLIGKWRVYAYTLNSHRIRQKWLYFKRHLHVLIQTLNSFYTCQHFKIWWQSLSLMQIGDNAGGRACILTAIFLVRIVFTVCRSITPPRKWNTLSVFAAKMVTRITNSYITIALVTSIPAILLTITSPKHWIAFSIWTSYLISQTSYVFCS